MKFKINSRWTNKPLFEVEADSFVQAVENQKANLCGANLCGADLRGADLRGADLRDANLYDADLRDANLCGANLCDANLCGADLYDADLRDANLCGADLRGANLCDASLYGANLRGANLCGVPLIENIDAKILEAIERNKAAGTNGLRMDEWHGRECDETNWCNTTHCRAGYAICIAGKPGFDLERKVGTPVAAILLYLKSTPNEPIPDFYCGNNEAMKDIKNRAAKQLGAM